MTLTTTNTGGYPRIGDDASHQVLRRAIAGLEKGEMTLEELRAVEDRVTREAIREQEEAGLDAVTDGLIRWHDPVSHYAAGLQNVRINGLLRYFDTNFYFRQPVVKGHIHWTGSLARREYEFAARHAKRPVRPVLTGPVTLARLSIVELEAYRKDHALLVADYAAALARDVKELAAAGAAWVQVDEPALLHHPEDLPLAEKALAALAAVKGKTRILLHFSFGDATPLWDRLAALPADGVGLDFAYAPKLVDAVASAGWPKALGIGLLDGRDTRLEDERAVLKTLERILPRVAGESFLGPTCGLDHLPREAARRKMRHLAALARKARGAA